jgi:hypothetical protein
MDTHEEAEFREMVERALTRIRTVLETNKNPTYAADVPHRYDDKYLLAEFLGRMAIASVLDSLENAGLSKDPRSGATDKVGELREWAKNRAVILRFRAEEKCSFVREETKQVDSPAVVTEKTTTSGSKATTKTKIVTTVTEYFWKLEIAYELVVFPGTSDERAISLVKRAGSVEIKTAAKKTPRPQNVVRPHIDADIGFLLRQLDSEGRASFAIDRTHKECHTPRRNPQVDDACNAFEVLARLCHGVCEYFHRDVFPAHADHGIDLSSLDDEQILTPVLPVFENTPNGEGLIPRVYSTAFLEEQRRGLSEKITQLAKVFPKNESIITVAEAIVVVTLIHVARICLQYAAGVDSIEAMLRAQLIAAVGKELTPSHFAEYMEFHHRKLMKPRYQPMPFSHAIRRPEHYPEGVLSLEVAWEDGMPVPLSTTVASSVATRPMMFSLDAATRVSFLGDRFLHAFITHQFSDSSELALGLVARARQFSSFVLLVGRIASADVFEPKFGIIIQNKDVLTIPLMLEQIPSAKEFRDAIESLSPEQQRFAKAFRGMQLESTLFGVCVIQIKPQLEKLLKLPPDSLTKEIKLTQELLRLFIEYQIPSDLLSYDGPDDAAGADKLAKVKDYVARMQEMIDLSRKKEIEEAQQREAFRRAEADQSYVAPPMPPPMMPPPAPGMAASAGPVFRSGAPQLEQAFEDAPTRTLVKQAAAPPESMGESHPAPTVAEPVRQATASPTTSGDGAADDYTRIPTDLETRLEALDTDGAVRPTIIHPAEEWMKSSQKGLLSEPESESMYVDEQKTEKNRAFDLLDALSRSGTLAIDHASLHVVIAATHAFDKTLLDAVIQDNVNPIEKVERSLVILASTIHRVPAIELLAENQRERFLTYSPRLGDLPPAAT